MSSYIELRCFDCGCKTGVFYYNDSSPFYHYFYCESCMLNNHNEDSASEDTNYE